MIKTFQISAMLLAIALCAAPAGAQMIDPANVPSGLHPGTQGTHSEIFGDSSLPQTSGQNPAR